MNTRRNALGKILSTVTTMAAAGVISQTEAAEFSLTERLKGNIPLSLLVVLQRHPIRGVV
jgi:hypothetical protein